MNLAYALAESRIALRVRLLLNTIFVVGISSYLFESFYFDYELLDLANYRAIYWFFVDGSFIVPAAIFFVTLKVTSFLGTTLFKVPNLLLGESIKRKIRRYSIDRNFPEGVLSNEQQAAVEKFVSFETGPSLKDLFRSFSKLIDSAKLARIQNKANIAQATVEAEFVLVVRALFAMLIYFNNVSHFGWFLLVIIILILVSSVVLQTLAYQFAEIIPFVVSIFGESEPPQDNPEPGK